MLFASEDEYDIHLYKESNGALIPIDEKEIYNPTYKPIVVLKVRHMQSATPLVYEDSRLYHLYHDGVSGERIKEEVELRAFGHIQLIQKIDAMLRRQFNPDPDDSV